MTARAAINCWDCTTRGLDAASALDYTKSLRIMSNTLHRTTIASFYQASEDMYNIFDKVMVLDKGVCVYFGPANKAKEYFEELGFQCEKRKSTPDFLTGITNPNERKVRPGFENQVPKTAADMERRYLTSQIREDMAKELTEYEAFIEREVFITCLICQILILFFSNPPANSNKVCSMLRPAVLATTLSTFPTSRSRPKQCSGVSSSLLLVIQAPCSAKYLLFFPRLSSTLLRTSCSGSTALEPSLAVVQFSSQSFSTPWSPFLSSLTLYVVAECCRSISLTPCITQLLTTSRPLLPTSRLLSSKSSCIQYARTSYSDCNTMQGSSSSSRLRSF